MTLPRLSNTQRIVPGPNAGEWSSEFSAPLPSGGRIAVTVPSVLLDAEDVVAHLRELADACACAHDLIDYESAARDEVLRVALALRGLPRANTLRDAEALLAEYAVFRDLAIELVTHWTRAEVPLLSRDAN